MTGVELRGKPYELLAVCSASKVKVMVVAASW